MATEQVERELRRQLRELLGDVAGMALIEKFPPSSTDQRFDAIDARFAQIDARFTDIDLALVRIDGRFEALEHRLTSTFRGELNAAITAQTRTIMMALLGAIATVGGVAVAVAGLAG